MHCVASLLVGTTKLSSSSLAEPKKLLRAATVGPLTFYLAHRHFSLAMSRSMQYGRIRVRELLTSCQLKGFHGDADGHNLMPTAESDVNTYVD